LPCAECRRLGDVPQGPRLRGRDAPVAGLLVRREKGYCRGRTNPRHRRPQRSLPAAEENRRPTLGQGSQACDGGCNRRRQCAMRPEGIPNGPATMLARAVLGQRLRNPPAALELTLCTREALWCCTGIERNE